MRVAITFGDQAEHERRGDEQGYSSLRRREAKPLPHFIEFETPALFDHKITSASSREMSCRLSQPARPGAGNSKDACSTRQARCLCYKRADRPRAKDSPRQTRTRHETCKDFCCI